MAKQIIKSNESSNIIWNSLEEMVRAKVREFIQDLLEAEIDELVGRSKSERRRLVDSPRFIAMATANPET